MTIDELVGELVRLSVASPHGGETVVLLKFKGDVGIQGASLGSPRLTRGRTVKAPVVLLQSQIARCSAPKRRLPGRTDRSDGESEDSMDEPDHAEMSRIQLCRVIARKIQQDAATGERALPLEHLLRLIETERFGNRWRDTDAGQTWMSHDRSATDFARALAICEATGAVVVHSGSQAVY